MTAGNKSLARGPLARFGGGGVAGSFAVLIIGTAVSQVVLVITSPIVTRLYTASDFGVWSLFTSVIMTVAVVANWRYELAIVLPEDDEEAAGVLTLSLITAALMVAVTIALVLLFGPLIARATGAPELEPWLWLMPICLLLAGIYQPLIYWSTRKKRFLNQALAQIGQSAGIVLFQIGIALVIGRSEIGLILGTVVGQIAMVCILFQPAWSQRSLFRPGRLLKYMGASAHKFRNFPLYTAPYSFIGQLSKRALFLMLGVFATTQDVGLFALAMKLTYLPASFIAAALNQIFFQKAAREIGTEQLEQFVVRTMRIMALGIAPALVFFLFNSGWILDAGFDIIFGKGWAGASSYTVSLTFPSVMLIFMSWLDRMYDVLGRQKLALWMQGGYDIVILGAFALSLAFFRDAEIAVAIYSGLTTAYYCLWLVVTFRVAGFSIRGLGRVAWLFFRLCLTASAVHWVLALTLERTIAAGVYLVLAAGYFVYVFSIYRKRTGSLDP